MLVKFAADTNLKGAVSVLDDRIIIQTDLDKLEQWPEKKKNVIYRSKCSTPDLVAAQLYHRK